MPVKWRHVEYISTAFLLLVGIGAILCSQIFVSHGPQWLQTSFWDISVTCSYARTQGIMVFCLLFYFGVLLFLDWLLSSNERDWLRYSKVWLAAMIVWATGHYVLAYGTSSFSTQMLVLLAGIVTGQMILVWARWQKEDIAQRVLTPLALILTLLAMSALCQFQPKPIALYNGISRWNGFWNNPNTYGELMGMGVVLTIGLFGGIPKKAHKMKKLLPIVLFISAGMMAVGLLFSYSRGAWLGTTIGLLYLAKAHGKFKWSYLLPVIFIATAIVMICWKTQRTSPWYLQRLDLSRGSEQHRLMAWRAGFAIMRDHPFGVGWNRTVEIYERNYSPPEGGAVAITTNDYLMLGTQLGIPALACFIVYVALCLKNSRFNVQSQKSEKFGIRNSEFGASSMFVMGISRRRGSPICQL